MGVTRTIQSYRNLAVKEVRYFENLKFEMSLNFPELFMTLK